jgi:hypothetical protein
MAVSVLGLVVPEHPRGVLGTHARSPRDDTTPTTLGLLSGTLYGAGGSVSTRSVSPWDV